MTSLDPSIFAVGIKFGICPCGMIRANESLRSDYVYDSIARVAREGHDGMFTVTVAIFVVVAIAMETNWNALKDHSGSGMNACQFAKELSGAIFLDKNRKDDFESSIAKRRDQGRIGLVPCSGGG